MLFDLSYGSSESRIARRHPAEYLLEWQQTPITPDRPPLRRPNSSSQPLRGQTPWREVQPQVQGCYRSRESVVF